jgi:hypothetical protein
VKKSKQVSLSMTEEYKSKIAEIAEIMHITKSDAVRRCIDYFYSKLKPNSQGYINGGD